MMLFFWFVFAIVVPILVLPLNAITIPYLDLPLGFFAASRGALIAFTLILFVFARGQEAIDRDHFSGGR